MDPTATEIDLLSVGHSNHSLEDFVELLRRVGVEVLVDVRSVPVSAYLPHFNQEPFRRSLKSANIGYVFLGEELGGRPNGIKFYDSDGRVRYDLVAKSSKFREGLKRLTNGAKGYRTAMMCSEGHPDKCHRHLLIARVLDGLDISVTHVLPDGSTRSAAELLEAHRPIPTLFGQEEQSWISIQSVLPNTQPQISSAS